MKKARKAKPIDLDKILNLKKTVDDAKTECEKCCEERGCRFIKNHSQDNWDGSALELPTTKKED